MAYKVLICSSVASNAKTAVSVTLCYSGSTFSHDTEQCENKVNANRHEAQLSIYHGAGGESTSIVRKLGESTPWLLI